MDSPFRRPAGDQAHRARPARRALAAGRRCARPPRRAPTTTRCGRSSCELGWPGIAVAEEHGGQGLGMVELSVLLEELGYAVRRVAVPGPLLAAPLIEHAGSRRAARALAARRSPPASARRGVGDAPSSSPTRRRRRHRAGRRATARARRGRRGVEARRRRSTPTRRYGRVARRRRRAAGGDVAAALDRALVAVAAELVGVCQRALDMTRRLRQGAQAVRRAGRHLPGRPAPRAQMLLDTEGGRSADLLRRVDRRRRARAPADAAAMAKAGVRRRPRRHRRARSSCTAASASPGRPTCTGSTSARSSTRAARRRGHPPRPRGAARGDAGPTAAT